MSPATAMRPLSERFVERIARCALGLACFGTGIACFVKSEVGVPPWDVFHQGVAERTDLRMGTVIVFTGIALLVLWIPLRQRPGIGTIMNALEIGLVENLAEDLLPDTGHIAVRLAYLALGMLLIAGGSGLYIGAELGTGPRDGLMVGINQRFGVSIRLARTIVEVVVMVVGLSLGGTIGVGTFVFAFGIGPLVQTMLGVFKMSPSSISAASSEAAEQ